MTRTFWLALVAVALLIALSPAVAHAQEGDQPVERTDKKDTKVVPGISNFDEMDPNALAQIIIAAGALVGINIPPAQALAQALALIHVHGLGGTLSRVTTTVTQGVPPTPAAAGVPTKRSDRVRIVTILPEGAPDTTKDHENGHRTINETLANGDFLTAFMITLIRDTGLGDADINDLMNSKLFDLENEVNGEWDALSRTFKKNEKPNMDQKAAAETLAALKRDVMAALTQRLMDAEAVIEGGTVSKLGAQGVLASVDIDIIAFGASINNLDQLNGFMKRAQKNMTDLIDEILNPNGRGPFPG